MGWLFVGILCIGLSAYLRKEDWLPYTRMAKWRLYSLRRDRRVAELGLSAVSPPSFYGRYEPPLMFLIPSAMNLRRWLDRFLFAYTPLFPGREYFSKKLIMPRGSECCAMVLWRPAESAGVYVESEPTVLIGPPRSIAHIKAIYNPMKPDGEIADWHGVVGSEASFPAHISKGRGMVLGWIIKATQCGEVQFAFTWYVQGEKNTVPLSITVV